MKHVRVLLWLAVAALAALLAGCGGGGGGGVATTAVVQGLVSDNLGAPLPGATIAVGAATATSDADGAYTLAVVPGANVKVTASRAGLTSTFKVITLTVGQTMPLNFTLIPVGKSNALANMDTTDTVADSGRGASVTLPAGSVVIEGTDTVVTDAVVEVTNAVPTDPGYAGNFPGMFVGTQNGADVAIESFGYVTITITSGGQKCNLGAGQTAEIAIPVAVGADPGTPTIPLWWLDETTGKWIHEGDAVRDATVNPVVYRATVTHFSSYNLDRPIEDAIPFTITVKRADETPVAGASVVITSTNNTGGGIWEGRGVTGADGTVRFETVAPGLVTATAAFGTLAGDGYGYELAGGEATMTITLLGTVERTFTVVYDDNGVEKPAANIEVYIWAEGQGHNTINVTTNAQGVVTLNVTAGMPHYGYGGSITVDGKTYSLYENAESLDGIPAKWVLTLTQTPN